jgi:hypothetical protein
VAEPLTARPSCPDCGARASARSRACAECGYRFVEDSPRGGRPRLRSATPAGADDAERRRIATLAGAAGALVAAAVAALLVTLGGADADDAGQDPPSAEERRRGPEVLARNPLSARAAERRLEERYGSAGDDDTASASCDALQPRPAHAIRWCRIRYAHGGERTVIVLSNPQGHELLVER